MSRSDNDSITNEDTAPLSQNAESIERISEIMEGVSCMACMRGQRCVWTCSSWKAPGRHWNCNLSIYVVRPATQSYQHAPHSSTASKRHTQAAHAWRVLSRSHSSCTLLYNDKNLESSPIHGGALSLLCMVTRFRHRACHMSSLVVPLTESLSSHQVWQNSC